MLKLSDFFQPLNLVNLLSFISALIFFDVIGTSIKRWFVTNDKVNLETRIVNWLMGLGFFIFLWFLLGFFIVPTQANILISVLVLLGVSLPWYLKDKSYLPLLRLIKPLIIPIILILPFLPPTFVRASLPPYLWDEMAYHFISPYASLHGLSQFWQFNGGLYANLPRLIDTLYILAFSVTRTYSVVRLIQFAVFVSTLFTTFLLVKRLMGKVSAFLFVLILLSLPLELPYITTIGYVDLPALCFLLLGLVFGMVFLFSGTKKDYLVLSSVFWAMSVGTKYTTLISFGAFIISFLLIYWIKNRDFSRIFDKKFLLKIVIGLIIFGGYWYIKNFVVYGNPIYPFLFPCWGKFASDCATGASFFGTWTLAVNSHTFYKIIQLLLPQNNLLPLALLASSIFIFFSGNQKSKFMLIMLILAFGVEIVVLKYFSGFDGRYQRHLMLILVLIIVLSASVKLRNLKLKMVRVVLILILAFSCVFYYVQNVRELYNPDFLKPQLIEYALGKENIYEWLNYIFPDTSAAVVWCENPKNGPVPLTIFDPDMIWYRYDGLMRVYLIGCYDSYVLAPSEWKNFAAIAKGRKLKIWAVSVNKCLKSVAAGPEAGTEDGERITQMRQLNNTVICNSTEIVPNLYYFDYSSL